MNEHYDEYSELAQASGDESSRKLQQKRRRERVKLKTNTRKLVMLSLLSTLSIGALAFLLIYEPGKSAVQYPEDDKKEEDKPRYFTTEQHRKYQAFVKVYDKIMSYRAGSRMKPLQAKAKQTFDKIQAAWADKFFDEAESHFVAMDESIDSIEALRGEELTARETRTACLASAKGAKDVMADEKASEVWAQAAVKQAAGEKAFEREAYALAQNNWTDASGMYDRSRTETLYRNAAEKSRDLYTQRLTKRYKLEEIEAMGGEPWGEISKLIASAHTAFSSRTYEAAAKHYDAASESVSAVERTVSLVIGGHYWAVNAGYMATDILLHHANEQSFDEAQRKEVVGILENLMLPEGIVAKMPTAEDVAYRVLAGFLLQDVKDAITSTRDKELAGSFSIGVQMRLIERLLKFDREAMSKGDKAALASSINAIRSLSQSSGYSDAFKAGIDGLVASLNAKPEFAAIQKGREAWRELIIQMRNQENAMELVPRGGGIKPS
jgi:hypothetical protein